MLAEAGALQASWLSGAGGRQGCDWSPGRVLAKTQLPRTRLSVTVKITAYCAAVLTPPSLLGLTRAPPQKSGYRAAWTTVEGPRAADGSAVATAAVALAVAAAVAMAVAVSMAVAVVAVVSPAVLGVAPLGVVPAPVLDRAPARHDRAAALVMVGAIRLSWH